MITRQVLGGHQRVLDQCQDRADAAVSMIDEYDGHNGIDLPNWDTVRWIIGELQAAHTNTKLIALIHIEDAEKTIAALDAETEQRRK